VKYESHQWGVGTGRRSLLVKWREEIIVKNDSVPTSPLFKPLLEKRTFKEIANQIRQLINSRALKPGDKLPSENELAVQFRAGRLSVREGLRMLEQAGLIVVKQGSTGGSYVKELDSTVAVESFIDLMWQGDVSTEDLTDARSSIETLILTKAFDCMTEEMLGTLDASVQGLENLLAAGERNEYPVDPTLTDFHMLLAEATNNPIFPIILKVLLEMTKRVMTPAKVGIDRLREHVISHRAVVTALRRGDLNAAHHAMKDHMIVVSNRGVMEEDLPAGKEVLKTVNMKNTTNKRTDSRKEKKGR
jgi:GntR family transcriptional regulator, transcriptional repressor for pyruvate dehydrogenase complex